MIGKSRIRAISSAFIALFVATAPHGAGAAARRGGVLQFAVSVEPKNFDCDSNTSFAFLQPIAPFYSTLLKFDAAHYPRIVGDIAQSWQVSADRRTYIFKLRPHVLFQDGSRLTSADVKASYERIINPPPGVVSARRVDYAAISQIDTPDPLTIVFHLRWPDAAMLPNFASPWNCIYSARRLAGNPLYPETHVLGTGAFVFERYVKGRYLAGKRWNKYFVPGEPYLDGFRALFIKGKAEMKAYLDGEIMADFRGVSPVERDQLVDALGNKVKVSESPWLSALLVVFNTKRPPFNDARVRRALSLAIDRWGAAQALGRTTFLRYVGGLMRPGSFWATPPAELAKLPGFGHDIEAAQSEARRLLAEAGVPHLKLTLLVRKIPMPHYAGAALLEKSWRAIGVTTKEERLSIWDWQKKVASGDFDVAQDFQGDYFDDPTIQLAKYVSPALSPVDYSGEDDHFLDALYIGQAVTPDPQKRLAIVRAFERHELDEAYTVPLLWWNRIVVTSAKLRGWHITPSHFIGQDLAGVWIDPSQP